MVFMAIGRFDNELKTNKNAKALLTGADVLSNYETTDETEARRAITLTGTYSGTGTATQVFINPNLAVGTGTGQLENAANITTRGEVMASVEVFNMGTIVTGANGVSDFNGREVSIARSRVGRLAAQFPDDSVRLFEIAVAITQTDPDAIGLVV